MSSSGHSSDDPLRQTPDTEESPETTSRQQLERVLEETLSRSAFDESLQADEKEALVKVAQRYHASGSPLDAIVPGLVSAILTVRLRRLKISPETWQAMCHQISESLMDAPHARARINDLWSRLCECVK
jgi:hypothetical protein